MINDALVRDHLQEVAVFADLPRNYVSYAHQAWIIIESDIIDMLHNFYDFIEDSGFREIIERHNRERLIRAQYEHWKSLFSASFSEEYIHSIKAIGLKHRIKNLSPSAYISGYGFLVSKMTRLVSETLTESPEEALEINRTIQSLVFIDMSLALSVYNDEVELL